MGCFWEGLMRGEEWSNLFVHLWNALWDCGASKKFWGEPCNTKELLNFKLLYRLSQITICESMKKPILHKVHFWHSETSVFTSSWFVFCLYLSFTRVTSPAVTFWPRVIGSALRKLFWWKLFCLFRSFADLLPPCCVAFPIYLTELDLSDPRSESSSA